MNDISSAEIGFDSEENEVTIVDPGGDAHVPQASKPEVAAAVLDFVQASRAREGARA